LLLVSWLLVAFVPGLLMLATFWLGRLESVLTDDTLTARDVADFLAHAESVDVGMLARAGMTEALDSLHRRRAERGLGGPVPRSGAAESLGDAVLTTAVIVAAEQPGPPPVRHKHSRANRQFGPPRHANRV
jgi:hypothetical protein